MKIKVYGQEVAELTSEEREQLGEYADLVRASYRPSLKRSDTDQLLEFDVNPEEPVELTFDDGTVWYVEAGELPLLFDGKPLRSEEADSSELILRPILYVQTGDERGFLKLINTLVRVFRPDDVRQGTLEVAKAIEEKQNDDIGLNGTGLYMVDNDEIKYKLAKLPSPDFNYEHGKPVLLMIHGFGANTKGAFGNMIRDYYQDPDGANVSPYWRKLKNNYGDHILSFEHKSLTEGPIANLRDLLTELIELLKAVAAPKDQEIHLFTQSRGGLVGEFLTCCCHVPGFIENGAKKLRALQNEGDAEILEAIGDLLNTDGWKFRITKFVRVCCPANGTHLLTDRLDPLANLVLNCIFNVVDIATLGLLNEDVGRWRRLTLSIAKNRTNPDLLPGMYSMLPGSHYIQLLNTDWLTMPKKEGEAEVPFPQKLYVIQGDAQRGHKLFRPLIWRKLSQVFPNAHDFVVDTDSMTKGLPRRDNAYYLPIKNGVIQHLLYYKDSFIQQAIALALLAENPDKVPDFKPVSYAVGAQNREGVPFIPDGVLENTKPPSGSRPIVVLLPGIMGSNLEVDGTRIWVNFGKMLTGGLKEIQIDKNGVTADSVVGDAYRALHSELGRNKFDVVIFPYDWRRSIKEAGAQLEEKLKKLLDHKQPIHFIAHSMGGLVLRQLMATGSDTWKTIKSQSGGSRCILLGTPWKGSYLIPQVITGFGRTINALSQLDLFHSKQQLLNWFVKFPGLLELLPYQIQAAHDFHNIAIWKAFEGSTKTGSWTLPDHETLKLVSENVRKLNVDIDLSNVIYVAGHSELTVNNVMYKNRFGHRLPFDEKTIAKPPVGYSLIFTSTDRGDGSVTWDDGIPKDIRESGKNLYYASTEHGELANDPKNFPGIIDLLTKGFTFRLDTSPPSTRGQQEVELPAIEPLPNTNLGLLRAVLGTSSASYIPKVVAPQSKPVNVSILSSHLKFASFPIMVGHFVGDAIMNAERVIDIEMNFALSDRQQLEIYPGALGTSMVVLDPKRAVKGAIVVGLGTKEGLTQSELAKSIQQACLKYILSQPSGDDPLTLSPTPDDSQSETNGELGISALLIGSGYGNLPMSNSLSAILEGICNANIAVQRLKRYKARQITRLEVVEIYRDKAEQAFIKLQEQQEKRFYPFRLEYPIVFKDGTRNLLDLDEGRDWWARVMATEREIEGRKGFYITANSGFASVPERNSLVNPSKIAPLLAEAIEQPVWDIRLASAMFGLFVPKDFHQTFRSQQNILWILDKTTAKYPLELLHYDNKPSEPMAVRSGMIRQLSSHYSSPVNTYPDGIKALVIGDPKLADQEGIPQLPGAALEAETVNQLLGRNGYETILLIRSTAPEVFKYLFEGYRVLHIASHGVISFGKSKETGILLSDGQRNTVITTAEINQIAPVPELVFVNCCYLGRIDPSIESHFREKYQLAANIGTQFIENGSKAVVVAGWPVDDRAALLFAEEFYKAMLSGVEFGEAVQMARKACYHSYGHTNTWGAYQCYGDPFFKLTSNGNRKVEKTKRFFRVAKEAIIEMEKWLIQVRTDNRYGPETLMAELSTIQQSINQSNLGADPVVIEYLINCYDEIGSSVGHSQALDLIVQLSRLEDDYVSARLEKMRHTLLGKVAMTASLESYLYAQLNRLPMLPDPFNEALEGIERQLKLSSNFHWNCLLGDTLRRKAAWQNKSLNYLTTLQNMEKAFYEALKVNQGLPMDGKRIHALYYWVLANCINRKNEAKFLEKNTKIAEELLAQPIEDCLKTIYNDKSLKPEIQQLNQRILAMECQLLFIKDGKQHAKALKKIKSRLSEVFKLNGSPKMREDHIERLQFVLLYVNNRCLSHHKLYEASINDLMQFLKPT